MPLSNYLCEVCGKSYSRYSSLQGHMSIHSEEIHEKASQAPDCFDTCCHGNKKSGDCPDRSDGSTGINHAIRNTSSMHNNKETKKTSPGSTQSSEVLSKRRVNQSVRVRTVQKREGEKGVYFECEVCKQRLTQLSSLRSHMRKHTGERPYKCKDCEKSFTFYQCLWNHSRKHTGKKNYTCKLCSKKYIYYQSLWFHKKKQCGKPYNCKVYAKKHMYKRSLKKHSVSHTGEMPYKCTVCNKGFAYFKCFLKHKQQHIEQNSDLNNTVKENVSTSKKKRELARPKSEEHRRNSKYQGRLGRTRSRTDPTEIAKKELPWSCHVCGKNVASWARLEMHLRIHTGERPYKCSLCPKAFIDNIGLRKHKKLHEGKGKACFEEDFVHSNRKGHNPSREGQQKKSSIEPGDIKSFECEVCNEHFKRSSSLKRHVMKHSSIKPYSCEECKRDFKLKGWLFRHSCLAHKNRCVKSSSVDYVCKYCRSIYLSVEDLTDHQKRIECQNCGNVFHCSCMHCRHLSTCSRQDAFSQEALAHKDAESTESVFQTNHSNNDAVGCDDNPLEGCDTHRNPTPARSVNFELWENHVVHDNSNSSCDALESIGFQDYHHPVPDVPFLDNDDYLANDSLWAGYCYEAMLRNQDMDTSSVKYYTPVNNEGVPAIQCDICDGLFASEAAYHYHLVQHFAPLGLPLPPSVK